MKNFKLLNEEDFYRFVDGFEYYLHTGSKPNKKVVTITSDLRQIKEFLHRGKISILDISNFPKESTYSSAEHLLEFCQNEEWDVVLKALDELKFSRYSISLLIKLFRNTFTKDTPKKVENRIEEYHELALETL